MPKNPRVRAWVSPNGKLALVSSGGEMFAHTAEVGWCKATGAVEMMMIDDWELPSREARKLDRERRKAK